MGDTGRQVTRKGLIFDVGPDSGDLLAFGLVEDSLSVCTSQKVYFPNSHRAC